MIDCRQVKQLLPLWIGQDLPDVSSSTEVAQHLENCVDCQQQQKSLQSSLEFLQSSSSKTLAIEPARPSVWPQLAVRINEWEDRQSRDRFNGWIPASVMALAVVLMVSVSITSILHEFTDGGSSFEISNLFDSDQRLGPFRSPNEPENIKPQTVEVRGEPNQKERTFDSGF